METPDKQQQTETPDKQQQTPKVDWETQKLNLVYKAFVEMMQEIEEQKTPDNEEEKEDEE